MGKGLIAALILAGIGYGTWRFYSDHVVTLPSVESGFTQFYMLGPGGLPEDYPQLLEPGEELFVRLGLENNEGHTQTYYVVVTLNGRLFAELEPFTVQDGLIWLHELRFMPPEVTREEILEFLLYREGDGQPYRSLRLWVYPQVTTLLPSLPSVEKTLR